MCAAWLKAGGEFPFVRESIRGWLAAHATDRSANFLYEAWLKAGGEPALIRDDLRALDARARPEPQRPVCTPRMDRGGRFIERVGGAR